MSALSHFYLKKSVIGRKMGGKLVKKHCDHCGNDWDGHTNSRCTKCGSTKPRKF